MTARIISTLWGLISIMDSHINCVLLFSFFKVGISAGINAKMFLTDGGRFPILAANDRIALTQINQLEL